MVLTEIIQVASRHFHCHFDYFCLLESIAKAANLMSIRREAGGAHSVANDSDNCHCAKPKAKLWLCNRRGVSWLGVRIPTFSRVLFWVPIMIASDSMLMQLTSGKGSTKYLCKSWANTILLSSSYWIEFAVEAKASPVVSFLCSWPSDKQVSKWAISWLISTRKTGSIIIKKRRKKVKSVHLPWSLDKCNYHELNAICRAIMDERVFGFLPH